MPTIYVECDKCTIQKLFQDQFYESLILLYKTFSSGLGRKIQNYWDRKLSIELSFHLKHLRDRSQLPLSVLQLLCVFRPIPKVSQPCLAVETQMLTEQFQTHYYYEKKWVVKPDGHNCSWCLLSIYKSFHYWLQTYTQK